MELLFNVYKIFPSVCPGCLNHDKTGNATQLTYRKVLSTGQTDAGWAKEGAVAGVEPTQIPVCHCTITRPFYGYDKHFIVLLVTDRTIRLNFC